MRNGFFSLFLGFLLSCVPAPRHPAEPAPPDWYAALLTTAPDIGCGEGATREEALGRALGSLSGSLEASVEGATRMVTESLGSGDVVRQITETLEVRSKLSPRPFRVVREAGTGNRCWLCLSAVPEAVVFQEPAIRASSEDFRLEVHRRPGGGDLSFLVTGIPGAGHLSLVAVCRGALVVWMENRVVSKGKLVIETLSGEGARPCPGMDAGEIGWISVWSPTPLDGCRLDSLSSECLPPEGSIRVAASFRP